MLQIYIFFVADKKNTNKAFFVEIIKTHKLEVIFNKKVVELTFHKSQ